jgi:6-phosphogluconolactonase
MTVDVQVVADPAADCAALLHGFAAGGGGELVLTGGSTPGGAYRQAAALGGDWSGVRIWFSDERCVPADDALSNYRLVSESLLSLLGERGPHAVERMAGELGPVGGADAYERALRDAGSPRFDLVLLGLGPDAHIASLFPGQESLSEPLRLAVGVPEAGHEPYVPRISLTLPALAKAERIVFLVTGAAKEDAVAAAFDADAGPDPAVPASLLVATGAPITVLLDDEAATRL